MHLLINAAWPSRSDEVCVRDLSLWMWSVGGGCLNLDTGLDSWVRVSTVLKKYPLSPPRTQTFTVTMPQPRHCRQIYTYTGHLELWTGNPSRLFLDLGALQSRSLLNTDKWQIYSVMYVMKTIILFPIYLNDRFILVVPQKNRKFF